MYRKQFVKRMGGYSDESVISVSTNKVCEWLCLCFFLELLQNMYQHGGNLYDKIQKSSNMYVVYFVAGFMALSFGGCDDPDDDEDKNVTWQHAEIDHEKNNFNVGFINIYVVHFRL